MLFDPKIGGHHSSYLLYLITYWCQNKLDGELHIVTSPQFPNQHPEIINLIENYDTIIKLIYIETHEYERWEQTSNVFRKIFLEWNIYVRYAKIIEPDYAVLMYLDNLQIPILLGKSSPCPFSGIYFRPTFHYFKFSNYQPSWQDKLRALRQKIILFQVLKKSKFQKLLCLDFYAVDYINQKCSNKKAIHLADPIRIKPVNFDLLKQLKSNLKIDSNRIVFLLFGRLFPRKGIYDVLFALESLPKEIGKKITLLLVGEIPPDQKQRLLSLTAKIGKDNEIQIIGNYGRIPEDEVSLYFSLSDVILAVYQNHVGMSGILLQAAGARKPVISSDYGLMGEIVRKYKMGLAIDSSNQQVLVDSLTEVVNQPELLHLDTQLLDQLLEKNDVDKFCRTIFNVN
ncbi:MAG: glycosyltransferase [Cyanobacterium sp. T60_A2020_053]|nr:glycosyltransferase [Cyanobacterium sp. T60_A2020_053]